MTGNGAISVRLFGELEVCRGGSPVALPRSKKTRALLAYLLVTERPHRRDRLCALFWEIPDDPRGALRWSLSKLRGLVNEPERARIVADRESVGFDAAGVAVDLFTVRSLLAGDVAAIPTPQLTAIADGFAGELLAHLDMPDLHGYQAWLVAERDAARIDQLRVLAELTDRLADTPEAAEPYAHMAVQLDPDDAEARTRLARLQAAQVPPPAPQPAAPAPREPATAAPERDPAVPATGSERKQVTVLYAGIHGADALISDLDPEAVISEMDPALQTMADAVERYGGTVSTVLGDGLQAVFGAPVAQEDHAVRACYAALAIRDGVRNVAGSRLRASVGLHSSEAVVRVASQAGARHYEAIGPAAQIARWLAEASEPGAIALTTETHHRVRGFFEADGADAVMLGYGAPVTVYRLTAPSRSQPPWERRPGHSRTRFVGRDIELSALVRVLQRAVLGHGEIVALVGEAGMGKSRLVHEFAHSSQARDWTVLETGAASHDANASFLPVAGLLRTWFAVEPYDSQSVVADKMRRHILGLDAGLAPVLPALDAVLDLPVADPDWQELSPPQRRRRTFEGLKTVLLRESQERPLIILLENLHWFDSETLAFLDQLIDGIAAARLLLLVTYRPEFSHTWAGKSYYSEVRLHPLPDDEAGCILDDLLGEDSSLTRLRRLLIERTGGRPLFLEESVQALIETGAFDGERGAFWLVKPVEQFELPASVQEVLAARIDRLAPAAKNLLQVASVIGHEVPVALLQPIADVDSDVLLTVLGQLQAAEFLYQTQLIPEPVFTFKHALTQEAAYASVLHGRRRVLHLGTVETVEARYADRLEEHVERLAHHALAAEHGPKAACYSRQAGDKALRRAALRAAVGYFERALQALHQLPETDETIAEDIDLRFELRNALFVLGDHDATIRHLERAAALAQRIGDDGRIGWSLLHLGATAWRRGDYLDAESTIHQARRIADEVGDIELRYLAAYRLGQVYYGLGAFADAATWLKRAIDDMQEAGAERRYGLGGLPFVFACSVLISSLAELGAFDEVERYERLGLATAEEAQDHYSIYVLTRGLGHAYTRQGRHDLAMLHLERAAEIGDVYELYTLAPPILSALGFVYVLQGRTEDGFALLHRSIDPAVWARSVNYARPYFWFAEAALAVGRRDEAREMIGRGRDVAESQSERESLVWANRLEGDLAAETDPDDAEQRYRTAITAAEAHGLRPHLAHSRFALGRLHLAAGRSDAARDELTAAAALYDDMGMDYWLPGVEDALAQVPNSKT